MVLINPDPRGCSRLHIADRLSSHSCPLHRVANGVWCICGDRNVLDSSSSVDSMQILRNQILNTSQERNALQMTADKRNPRLAS